MVIVSVKSFLSIRLKRSCTCASMLWGYPFLVVQVVSSSPVVSTTNVVILPVAHRVTVISRVECVFPAPAHGGRQRPPVRPDFAPDIHVLDQYERPIRQRRDRHSANFVRHVLRKSKRITISVMRIVGAGGTIFADRLSLIVQLF